MGSESHTPAGMASCSMASLIEVSSLAGDGGRGFWGIKAGRKWRR